MNALRVLSFNIRGSYVPDGENAWEKRAAYNVETLRRLDPDLLGFQELQTGNLATYERALDGYEVLLGPRYNNQAPYCYPSIFWKSGRLECLECGGFWLSQTPARFSASWGTDCIRSAAWAKLRAAPNGRPFVHLNTHLDHVSELARVEGARVVVERLAAFTRAGLPVLVSGDFNANPGSAAYRIFQEAGFRDVFLEAGGADGPAVFTFHDFQGRADGKNGRIDWLLARAGAWAFRARSCAILTDARPPLYPSDHYPLLAELEYE